MSTHVQVNHTNYLGQKLSRYPHDRLEIIIPILIRCVQAISGKKEFFVLEATIR